MVNYRAFNRFDQRQKFEYGSETDSEPDEQPQVVVLKKGDLTAEEADQEKKRIEKGMV